MYLAGRDKQDVSVFEDNLFVAAEEAAGSAGDDVDFVARVRLLGVRTVRGVELDAQASVPEQFDKALAFGSGQARESIVYSQVSLHDSTSRGTRAIKWPP
jgi:hypothetical protein